MDAAGWREAVSGGTDAGSSCVETLGPGSLLEATRATLQDRRKRFLAMLEGNR